METIEQVLSDLSAKELAAVFDVITKLPKTKENTALLQAVMAHLEKLAPDNFDNWLRQTKGASMRQYF